MLLELSSDQEFFRETTARFLLDQVPAGEVRRLRDDPSASSRSTGAGGPSSAGRRCSSTRSTAAAASAARGSSTSRLVADEFGRRAAPGPLIPTNVVAAALSDVDGDAHVGRARGLLLADGDRRRGASPKPHRTTGSATITVADRGRRRRRRARRREATGRVGGAGQPPAGHRPDRRRAHAGARPHRCARVSITPDAHRRPHPPVLRRPSTTCGLRDAVVGEVGRPTTQVERQLQQRPSSCSTPSRWAPCRRAST